MLSTHSTNRTRYIYIPTVVTSRGALRCPSSPFSLLALPRDQFPGRSAEVSAKNKMEQFDPFDCQWHLPYSNLPHLGPKGTAWWTFRILAKNFWFKTDFNLKPDPRLVTKTTQLVQSHKGEVKKSDRCTVTSGTKIWLLNKVNYGGFTPCQVRPPLFEVDPYIQPSSPRRCIKFA